MLLPYLWSIPSTPPPPQTNHPISTPSSPGSPKNPPKKSGRLLLTQVRSPPPSISNFPMFFFRRGGRPEHRWVIFFGQRYCLGSWNWNFDPFQVVPPPVGLEFLLFERKTLQDSGNWIGRLKKRQQQKRRHFKGGRKPMVFVKLTKSIG